MPKLLAGKEIEVELDDEKIVELALGPDVEVPVEVAWLTLLKGSFEDGLVVRPR